MRYLFKITDIFFNSLSKFMINEDKDCLLRIRSEIDSITDDEILTIIAMQALGNDCDCIFNLMSTKRKIQRFHIVMKECGFSENDIKYHLKINISKILAAKNILEFVEKLQEENTKKEKIFKPKTPEEQAAFFKAHGIKG